MRSLSSWRYGFQLLLLGVVHALTFAPEPLPGALLPYIEIVALACLAGYVFKARTVGAAAWSGFLFGLGQFTVGLYWIYISLNSFGGLAAPLSAGAVLILAAGLALYTTLAAALNRWLCGPLARNASSFAAAILTAAVWASCWAVTEWLRGTLFTGFPWLNAGYAHVDGPLSGWAPILGVYGTAWLAAFTAGAIALLALSRRSAAEVPAAAAVAVAIVLALAGAGLSGLKWSRPIGDPILVRLVQGNIPQSEKFDPQLMQRGMNTYAHLAALPPKQAGADPQLIVLPETVMPLFQDRYPELLWRQWQAIARERHATLLMGVPLHSEGVGGPRYTNSAIAFSGDTPVGSILAGTLAMRYDKHHLVPFGEFIPLGFHWFVDALNIPLGDFNRGAVRQKHFLLNGQVVAPNICYEDVFGEEIARSVADSAQEGPGATILVNQSNLAWFGNSWALRQHLQISRMRALETARPMLRATNTGMTAAIAADGAVRAQLPPQTPGVLDVEVQGMQGLTPYVHWRNWPVIGLCLLLLAGGWLRRPKPASGGQ